MTEVARPIFIIGAPRSGTTLLRAMLNRHSRIGLCDESYFFYWVAQRARVFGDLRDVARRTHAVDSYLATQRIRRLDLDLGQLRLRLLQDASTYPAFFLSLLRFYAESHQKLRCGEKTPQHALVATDLLNWYPEAQMIHLIRDPRDVVSSLKRMPWGSRSAWANAELWRTCVEGAERICDRPQFLRVQYEQLVAQPEAELRRVCDFLGEPWQAEMLTGDDSAKTDRWWFDRAQGNVDRRRIERWRSELTPDEVGVVEACAGNFLQQFGYVPAGPTAGLVQRLRAQAGARISSLNRKIHQRQALYYRWLHPDQLAAEEAIIDGHPERLGG